MSGLNLDDIMDGSKLKVAVGDGNAPDDAKFSEESIEKEIKVIKAQKVKEFEEHMGVEIGGGGLNLRRVLGRAGGKFTKLEELPDRLLDKVEIRTEPDNVTSIIHDSFGDIVQPLDPENLAINQKELIAHDGFHTIMNNFMLRNRPKKMVGEFPHPEPLPFFSDQREMKMPDIDGKPILIAGNGARPVDPGMIAALSKASKSPIIVMGQDEFDKQKEIEIATAHLDPEPRGGSMSHGRMAAILGLAGAMANTSPAFDSFLINPRRRRKKKVKEVTQTAEQAEAKISAAEKKRERKKALRLKQMQNQKK